MKYPANSTIYSTPKTYKKCRSSVLSAPTIEHAAHILRKLTPALSCTDHLKISAYHAARKEKLDKAWLIIANNAARATWGRNWHCTDYRICAIGSEQFSERYKRLLRHCAYNATKHGKISESHRYIYRYFKG